MANMAMAYGSSIASHGKDMMNKEVWPTPGQGWQDFWPGLGHHGSHLICTAALREEQTQEHPEVLGAARPQSPLSLLAAPFVSVNKLKYFFAVDTAYVAKKLGLLVFPYTHQNWEVQYSRDVPLPHGKTSTPDLYIPTMAFITYVLLAGMALGIQKRFSPEVLGLCASTALVWVVMEVLALLLGIYLATVQRPEYLPPAGLQRLQICGDDPQCPHGPALRQRWLLRGAGLTSSALMYFIVRSLRTAALGPDSMGARPRQRLQLYLTLGAAAFQPLIIYWLTFHLVR
uniref:Protein YIF1 n=1 Tax=Bos mutus grunniens TaxID=30521 RepID=A0A8B9YUK5_BOSMU